MGGSEAAFKGKREEIEIIPLFKIPHPASAGGKRDGVVERHIGAERKSEASVVSKRQE